MNESTSCPFCNLDRSRIFYSGTLVVGLWDAFAVSPGHALVVPRRHVASWFDATAAEQQEIVTALAVARERVLAAHSPDGFNIGVNVGAAAGQTIFHLHAHLIPRYQGDVPDPRGGVRHVLPAKANYLRGAMAMHPALRPLPHGRALIAGTDQDPFLPHLVGHLDQAVGLDMAVAFAMASGVARLHGHLQDLLDRGGRLRLLTGDYLGVTDPVALLRLLDLQGNKELRLFEAGGQSFHPKSYILYHGDGGRVAFVGSSNLSETALCTGVEWNYRTISSRDGEGLADVVQGFEALFRGPNTRPLDAPWVAAYAARRPRVVPQPIEIPLEPLPPATRTA